MKKKGQQSGVEAALLVLVITILVIVYIMFLPADQRADLLDDTSSNDDDDDNNDDDEVIYNLTLISEFPGRLDHIQTGNYTHSMPSVNLYTSTNANVLKSINPFILKNNWFEKQFESVEFSVENPQDTENLFLSFTAKTYEGALLITLNGQKLYEKELTSPNVEPIALDKEMLLDENVIEFSVSKVGFAFWKTHKYTIENAIIMGDVTDKTGQISKNIFTVSDAEYDNIEYTQLKFIPECTASAVGRLHIDINGEEVFSSIPDCGNPIYPIDVSHAIKPGKNTIDFSTEKGQILIDLLRVDTKLKSIIYPSYYFDLTTEQYEDVKDNSTELNLTLFFNDDTDSKQARIYLNGIRTYMFSKDREYTADLRNYIEDGTNSIKIEPYGDTIEIRRIKVYLR